MPEMHRRRRAHMLVEVIVAVAIVAVLIALLLPAVQKVRGAAVRTTCTNNVRQLTLGLIGYEAQTGRFPGVARAETTDWAVAVLPFVEQSDLATRFRPDYTTAQPENLAPARHRPALFRCPDRMDAPSFLDTVPATHYGMNAALARRPCQLAVESSRTLLVGELSPEPPMPWVVSPPVMSVDGGHFHGEVTTIGFVDGHVSRSPRTALATVVLQPGAPTTFISEP